MKNNSNSKLNIFLAFLMLEFYAQMCSKGVVEVAYSPTFWNFFQSEKTIRVAHTKTTATKM